jgi:hypothetical protein
MDSLNRQVAIIKPKEPYVNWINSLPGKMEQETVGTLQADCTAILLPHFDTDNESLNFVKKIYRTIFDYELYGWHTDENAWPLKRTFKLFQDWFNIEFHSEVIDFGKGPIVIEE